MVDTGPRKRHVTPGSDSVRRTQVVEAAYRCLARNGLAGLRMRDVAVEAGVNIATVHYHLTSKDQLIREVVEYAQRQFQEQAAAPPDPDPVRRLRAHLDGVFDLLDRDPGLGHVLADVALYAPRDPVVAEIVANSERHWREALQAMMAPLPRRRTRPVALLIILVVKGACLPPHSRPDMRAVRRELADQIAGLLADQH